MGYDFTGSRISRFPIDSFMALQHCSATALPVIIIILYLAYTLAAYHSAKWSFWAITAGRLLRIMQ